MFGSSSTVSADGIVDDVLNALGVTTSSGSISLDQILSALGITSSSSIDLNDVLTDLGFPANGGITLGDVLSLFNLTDSSTIPLPSVSIDSLLSDLKIDPNENLLTLLGIPSTLTLSPTFDLTGGPVATDIDDVAKDFLAPRGVVSRSLADSRGRWPALRWWGPPAR
ncbi:MAG TPA: hypothetical protein VE400_10415 [Mycobacterium sp.]|nr:hypothetical protein [Mycobacterium sp.]